jgi:hypothetical protein
MPNLPRALLPLVCAAATLGLWTASDADASTTAAHAEVAKPGHGLNVDEADAVRAFAGLTMTQLTPHRVFQRSAKTGGAADRGYGDIAVPIQLEETAALIECRLRDALAAGNPVLRAWTAAATNVPASSTSVACPTVSADQKKYLVDLRANSDDAQIELGSSPVMMGRVIVHWGQSQANRFVTARGTTPVSAPPTSSMLRHGRWSPIPDDALGLNPFLYMEGLANRVAVGFVTHAVDNSAVGSWLPETGINYPGLIQQVDLAGGFEAMDQYIGGTDLGIGTTPEAFVDAKRTVIRDLQDNHNPIWGRDTELVLSATTVRLANDVNHARDVEAQQAAERRLAAEMGGAYYEGWDIDMMVGDSVHHKATGNAAYGYGLSRAYTALRTRGAVIAGPTITKAAMSGVTIRLTLDMPPDAGSLTITGNPVSRFSAFSSGTTSKPLTIDSVRANRNEIVLTMATQPKGDVDIWLHRYPDPQPSLASDVIRDSFTTDGAPYGRLVEATVGAPVTAENPVQAVVASSANPSADKLVAQP